MQDQKKNIFNFHSKTSFPNAPIWIKVLWNDCFICQLYKPFPHQKEIAEKKTLRDKVYVAFTESHLILKTLYRPPQKEVRI